LPILIDKGFTLITKANDCLIYGSTIWLMKLEHELKSGCTKYDQKDMRVYLERKKE